jgi:hypothetical protein
MPRRLFTVEQANRTLPLVKRIVRDIVDAYGRWQRVLREFEVATAGSRADNPSPRAEELQLEAQALASDIQSCITELRELGIDFKGFDMGLIDFPSEMDGREVCLCWKLGEEDVRYWHEVDAGYAGRQPLAVALQES